VTGFNPATVSSTLNKWIVAKVAEAAQTIGAAIESYRFNEAADGLYKFTWGTFCDWYLEFTKPVFQGQDEALKAETRATTAWVLDHILILGQPIIPFVTHELWRRLAEAAGVQRQQELSEAPWPEISLPADTAQGDIDWVVDVVSAIRSVRAEMNVPPAAMIAASVKDASAQKRARLDAYGSLISANARLSSLQANEQAVANAAQVVVGEATIMLALGGVIDFSKERERLTKEIAKLESDIAAITKKLANESFVAKAPAEVVQENRDRQATADAERRKLKEALARIG
jgi:valyl-tRNA synthetase